MPENPLDPRVEAVAAFIHDSITDSPRWDARDDSVRDLYRDRAAHLLSVADLVDPFRLSARSAGRTDGDG